MERRRGKSPEEIRKLADRTQQSAIERKRARNESLLPEELAFLQKIDREDVPLEKQKFQQVYENEGSWFVRLDAASRGAEVPADVAKAMKLALWAQGRRDIPLNNKTREQLEELRMDCHKTAQFVIGWITRDKLKRTDITYQGMLFNDYAYEHFDSASELKEYLKKIVGNKLGYVQVMDWKDEDAQELNEASHSFLVARDERDRFVCFEKVGLASHSPLQITTVEDVYERQNGFRKMVTWAAAPLDENLNLVMRGEDENEEENEY